MRPGSANEFEAIPIMTKIRNTENFELFRNFRRRGGRWPAMGRANLGEHGSRDRYLRGRPDLPLHAATFIAVATV
jgi:hypothetical protein